MPTSPLGYSTGPSTSSRPAAAPSGPSATARLRRSVSETAKKHRGKIFGILALGAVTTGLLGGDYLRRGRRAYHSVVDRPTLEAMTINSWVRGKEKMHSSDEADRLMRVISAHTDSPNTLPAGEIGAINDLFNSPLLDVRARDIMRQSWPTLRVEPADLTTQNMDKIWRAVRVARAMIAQVALRDFKEDAVGDPTVNVDWVQFVNTHPTHHISEPGHLANVVVCLWRMGLVDPARAVAAKIFELPSWQSYMRDHPCEAQMVIQNCTEQGLLTNPVPQGDLDRLQGACAHLPTQANADAGVTAIADGGSTVTDAATVATDSGTHPDR